MRHNNYQRNWRPATTTYRILALHYKCIVDIEDFWKMMPVAYNWYVAVPKLAYWYRRNYKN
jgi:hypothetical protein